jgi:outer membrane protein assembly factor BamB
MASYSPVTDGKLVWVNFGTRGVHCFDVDGNNVWSTDLIPHFTIRSFGEGSSPALVEDTIIVVADHEGQSKIFAFDKDTGDVRWEKARDETTSWATPMPVMVDGRYQVVVNGTKQIRSYDLETGDIVWECSGLTILAIPSPVISDGKVFCTTGYQGQVMMALNLDGKGDITESDSVVWKIEEGTPYISSPLLYNGRIYMFDSLKANLSCYEASTGKPIYVKEKLEGLKQVYASPIGAAGRIYASDRKGTTIVLKESDSIEVLATNTLEDKFDASPVVVGDELYLKGAKYLYCIAKS